MKALITREQIANRIADMGKEITEYYQKTNSQRLIVIPVLKGSFIFAADLIREIKLPVVIDFVEASSYGSKTVSSGEVKVYRDFRVDIEGADVLVVEDIVDTGTTMTYMLKHIASKNPRSLKLASLLFKPARLKSPVTIDFLGYTIEDHFVVGYGLDLNEQYRQIPEVVIYDGNADR